MGWSKREESCRQVFDAIKRQIEAAQDLDALRQAMLDLLIEVRDHRHVPDEDGGDTSGPVQ